jgi:hypothetical protein
MSFMRTARDKSSNSCQKIASLLLCANQSHRQIRQLERHSERHTERYRCLVTRLSITLAALSKSDHYIFLTSNRCMPVNVSGRTE